MIGCLGNGGQPPHISCSCCEVEITETTCTTCSSLCCQLCIATCDGCKRSHGSLECLQSCDECKTRYLCHDCFQPHVTQTCTNCSCEDICKKHVRLCEMCGSNTLCAQCEYLIDGHKPTICDSCEEQRDVKKRNTSEEDVQVHKKSKMV